MSERYDYVIVGGGSAGSVLAGRLTEDPAVRVCLLEAGPADKSVLIHCPAGYAAAVKTGIANWSFGTVMPRCVIPRAITASARTSATTPPG